MHNEILDAILAKIKEYDTIMIFRHIRPDGDCKGATKGLQAILRLSFPEKQIHLINDDHSDYLAFIGDDDPEVPDAEYQNALGIVLDTATAQRIANQKYTLCKEIVKIDHHIDVEAYGDYNWVESDASSACEMIAKFYYTHRDVLKIDSQAATYLYAGMVTDSGRFRYSSVSGDTLRWAAVLLDQSIDTETLFAHLYLEDYSYYKFKAFIYENMNFTENGVAYVHVTTEMKERFGLTDEEASQVVSMMDQIKGCLCWLAFIDSSKDPGTIRVRLRSRFMTVNQIAEQHHGGGHACASGATVYSQEEMLALIAKADAASKEYKETHEGWL